MKLLLDGGWAAHFWRSGQAGRGGGAGTGGGDGGRSGLVEVAGLACFMLAPAPPTPARRGGVLWCTRYVLEEEEKAEEEGREPCGPDTRVPGGGGRGVDGPDEKAEKA